MHSYQPTGGYSNTRALPHYGEDPVPPADYYGSYSPQPHQQQHTQTAAVPNDYYQQSPYEQTQTTRYAQPPASQVAYAPPMGVPESPGILSGGYHNPVVQHPPAPPAANAVDESGLRWTWSTFPNSVRAKVKQAQSPASLPLPPMVLPMSCMYTPLKPLSVAQMVLADPRPDQCPTCAAFISCHSPVDARERVWVCYSCQRRNTLPPAYTDQHPALRHDTVEYILPEKPPKAAVPPRSQPRPSAQTLSEAADIKHPVFVFLIDTCLPHDEMASLKAILLQSLASLPSQSLVGLVTFGTRTTVWELNNTGGLSRTYVLRGDSSSAGPGGMSQMLQVNESHPVYGRFLLPLHRCEAVLSTYLSELVSGGEPVSARNRTMRTTGTAVDAATFLLESLRQHVNRGLAVPSVRTTGKVLLFTGGPCTRGLGTIVGTDKAEMMRSHRDIIEDNTPHYKSSYEFYDRLSNRLAVVDACLDVFAQSFDQVGIMEMRNAVNNTGGTFICGDTFGHESFSSSLERYFKRCDLRVSHGSQAVAVESDDSYTVRCAFGVHLTLHTSANTLVCGVLGPCNVDAEANKKVAAKRGGVSPVVVGMGGTTKWGVSMLDQEVTLGFVFDTATLDEAAAAPGAPAAAPSNRFLQFVTEYLSPTGERRIRVTSVVQPVAPPTAPASYYVQHNTFDQTCASTIIARMAVSILERFPSKWEDAKRWLDTMLVNFVRRYSTYQPNLPDTLRLEPCMTLFPSFMFNLRRSEYFMVVNISPDETTYKRHWLMREPVDNCVRMMQPTLDSYDLEAPFATTVPLDSSSLRPDNIVLMDAFFNVHIMWGATIFAWIQQGYQDDPAYEHFAALLEACERDAEVLLAERYPYPRFSRADANGSEARHIKTRVNPATTHNQAEGATNPYGAAAQMAATGIGERADLIYTDDTSIVKFMVSLKRAVVSTDNKTLSQG